MLKIFQICTEGNSGSVGRIAENIGILAIEKGWKSYIAAGRALRKSQSILFPIGSIYDIIVHGLLTRFFDRHGLGSRRATKRLVAKIQDIKPDIIHLHTLHGYYINIEILFDYLSHARIPVIWTFHDCWSITGHCAHFDFVGCNKWQTECTHCPQINQYPASLVFDRSRKNFILKKRLFTSIPNMTIVSVSNWLNNVVRDSFLGESIMKVIYNGIDVNLFSPSPNRQITKQKLNIVSGFMLLGVASPWSKKKGLFDFIELSSKIDKGDYIVLVGLNKSQIQHLPPNMIGILRTENQQELNELYVAADVFLNLSVEETFGLTTAEALASGTPAIVYDTTACPEVIDNKTGIVVPKNDIEGLISAIDTIKKNGKSYYSEACRQRAVNCFDKNERNREYLDLYKTTIINNSLINK